ncbi:class I SAM-dependent methyltransferase [Desulfosarcina sp.]|uniref:class I SAM-dependent methyltransferase n=1 Tax=Desulfosarcina sp. TaxID=2027861 RepID=UPI0035625EDC
MATHYHVEVVGITVSKEQGKLARQWCKGLPVTIKLTDYRRLTGTFDRIVSVGMFEPVGVRHYCTFMPMIHCCLALDGLFLLHTIAGNRSVRFCDPWISMLTYYLLACAGSFRSRRNQLWQIVFSKNGVPGGYESVR